MRQLIVISTGSYSDNSATTYERESDEKPLDQADLDALKREIVVLAAKAYAALPEKNWEDLYSELVHPDYKYRDLHVRNVGRKVKVDAEGEALPGDLFSGLLNERVAALGFKEVEIPELWHDWGEADEIRELAESIQNGQLIDVFPK